MDLISRQAAIDALIDALAWTWSGTWSEKAAIDAIKNLPSAQHDIVEVVRCKDCKYYNPIGVCIEMSSAVCEDSFCCWAERRTDERSD